LVNNGPRAAAVSLFVEDGQWNRLENSCTNRGALVLKISMLHIICRPGCIAIPTETVVDAV